MHQLQAIEAARRVVPRGADRQGADGRNAPALAADADGSRELFPLRAPLRCLPLRLPVAAGDLPFCLNVSQWPVPATTSDNLGYGPLACAPSRGFYFGKLTQATR